jgi:hypothetical protein
MDEKGLQSLKIKISKIALGKKFFHLNGKAGDSNKCGGR